MSTSRMRLSGGSVRKAALFLLPVALAGALVSVPSLAGTAAAAIPVPAATLTEINVPGTTPLSATAVDLAAAGYTAREFYAAGLANRYTGAAANTFTTATLLDSGNPYRTRVMVRYPAPAQVQRNVGRRVDQRHDRGRLRVRHGRGLGVPPA